MDNNTENTVKTTDMTDEELKKRAEAEEEAKNEAEAKELEKPKSKNIFAKNSSFNRFMMSFGSLILANMLFIVCSLGIITIGASMTALGTVVIKIKDEDDFRLVSTFFKAFGSNFIDATLPWIISSAILSAAIFGIYQAVTTGNDWGNIFAAGGCGVVAIIVLGFITYYFMLLSRYENTVTQHIKNAFSVSATNFFRSVLIWAIWFVAVMPFVVIEPVRTYAGWIWLMVGFAGVLFLVMPFYKKIFWLLETKQEDD